MIHTVGPVAQGGVGDEEKKALRSCYKNSLNAAAKNNARSVVRTGGLLGRHRKYERKNTEIQSCLLRKRREETRFKQRREKHLVLEPKKCMTDKKKGLSHDCV